MINVDVVISFVSVTTSRWNSLCTLDEIDAAQLVHFNFLWSFSLFNGFFFHTTFFSGALLLFDASTTHCIFNYQFYSSILRHLVTIYCVYNSSLDVTHTVWWLGNSDRLVQMIIIWGKCSVLLSRLKTVCNFLKKCMISIYSILCYH